jgi:glycerophosphoryl diester phosphodiesterase
MARIAFVVTVLFCGLLAGHAAAADPDRPATPPPTDFWQDKGFMNMAHQGGELEAPGNTLYAFKTAVRYRGADTLEMDSYVSADGVLMVTHDMRPSGTSNAPNSSDFEIRDLTVEQLKQYDFAWKFTPGKGHYGFAESDPHPYRGIATGDVPPPTGYSANDFRIATFEEVLEAFPDTPLNVDMKSYGPDPGVSLAAAEALAEIMNRHPERSEDVIVASFDQAAMERFHELAPGHKALSGSLDATLDYVNGSALTPVPVAVQPPDLFNLGTLLRTVPILKPLADYDGFAVHVWGSDNDPEQESDPFYARLIEEGADGFFTQQPGKLHQYLCEAGIRRPDGTRRCSAQPPDLTPPPETLPELRVHSMRGRKGLTRGRRSTFTVLIGNAGDADLGGIRACLKGAGSSARTVTGSCSRGPSLGPGDVRYLKLRVRPGRKAKSRIRLRLHVYSDGGDFSRTRRFRVVGPRACSKKRAKDNSKLCGTTDHL